MPRARHDLQRPAAGPRATYHCRVGRNQGYPGPRDLHGRFPAHDRQGHVHDQRRRARDREPARAFAGRVLQPGRRHERAADVQCDDHSQPRRLDRVRDRQRDQERRDRGHDRRSHRQESQDLRLDVHPRALASGPRLQLGDRRGDRQALRRQPADSQLDRKRQGRQDARGRAQGNLQEAASRRARERRERRTASGVALLRREALRSRRSRPLQTQRQVPLPHREPRCGSARRQADGRRRRILRCGPRNAGDRDALPHARRYDRGHPAPDQSRYRRRRQGRHRSPRQSSRAFGRRTAAEPVPGRPAASRARGARAHDRARHRNGDAAGAHQHSSGRGGDQRVLRFVTALAVHGPDELAGRTHAQAPALRARTGRSLARTRGLRSARRPPFALRPHLSDRDAGRPEHRLDRLVGDLRPRQQVRLHRDAVPRRARGHRDRRNRLPHRRPRRRVHHRAGQYAGRSRLGKDHERLGRVPLRRRVHRGARAARPVDGRLAEANRVGRDRVDSLPRTRRCKPRVDGRKHAASSGAAAASGHADRRHRHGVSRREGLRQPDRCRRGRNGDVGRRAQHHGAQRRRRRKAVRITEVRAQ